MSLLVRTAQKSTMNERMERLDPTIHHLREPGVVGHLRDGDVIITQQLRRAARGEQLDIVRRQPLARAA